MPLVSKPYNYNNGQTIDATQLDQNLDTLYNLINGLLDAVNIAAAGLNDPNKFAAEVITQAKSKGLVYTQDLYGQSWVVSGGVTTASGSPANQITVTTLIANILQADGSYRHVTVAGTTYVTSIINATYFLELQPDGTMNWAQTHSAQANYMPLAVVTSDASGNINVITDNRMLDPTFVRANTKNMNGLNGQAGINFNFDVWQRGTSFTNPISTTYTADRWKCYRSSSITGMTVTQQDGSGVYGSKYCLRAQRNSGDTSVNGLIALQALESINSQKFRGKKVTVSFYARAGANYSAASNVLNVSLNTGTGTDESGTGTITGNAAVINNNVTLTTSWQKFTASTFSVLADTVNQLFLFFSQAPTGTAGVNDYFEITQVQINVGDIALPFLGRSYSEEEALCKRYYERWNLASGEKFGFGIELSTTVATVGLTFLPKRTSPTIRGTGTPGDYGIIGLGGGATAATAITLTSQSQIHGNADVTVAAGLVGGYAAVLTTTGVGKYIEFDAEI